MGVKPGELRALTQIESQLAESDPSLATMFAVFAADPSRARECSRSAPPRRARAKWIAALVVLAMLFVMCVTVAALTAP